MIVRWVMVLGWAVFTLVAVGVYAWRHRTTTGALSFSLLMFAIADWSLAYALELLSRAFLAKMLWLRAGYLGIVATPVLWLAFALQYTGRGRWLSRRNVALLFLLPGVTLLLVWTSQAHRLFYNLCVVDASGDWPMLHVEYGPWFWVHTAFSYLCLLVGTLLLGGAFLRSSLFYRLQAGVLLTGALIPWIGNALYLTGLTPWPGLDLTPLAFTLSGLIVAFGLFRYKLLQVVPVARQAVVEGMPAAMIVLDAEDRIADLNPAARQLFNLTDREAIGRPARQVLRPVELVARFVGVIQADTELEWGEADCRRVYWVTISPLGDQTAGVPARLVLIWDVTAQAKAREALEQVNRRLQALQTSTTTLTTLLDPATLFERVMDQLEQFVPYRCAVLALYDEETERLTCVSSRGFSPEELSEVERTTLQHQMDWVVRHKAPLWVDDAEADSQMQCEGGRRSGLVLMVPLVSRQRCLGLLGLGGLEPAAYTPADRDLLLAFANQVAAAVENARLYEQEQARRRLASTLQEVGRILSTTLALDQVLELLMDQLARVLDYQGATVALLRGDRLEVIAARGFATPAPILNFSLDVSDNAIFQQMVTTGMPVILADVSQDPRWEWVEGVEFTRAWIGAPLTVKDRIIGQLSVYHPQPGRYSAEDGQTLLAFARQAAQAIENARMHEEATARAEALARQNRHLALLHEIARVAASTLDLTDLYQVLADTLAQIIGGDGCYITRIDETTGQVLGGAAYGPFRESYRSLSPPPGELTLTESVLKAGRPLPVEDVFHSPYLSPRIAAMFPARSLLGLPLRRGERDLGAVLIAFNEPHTFTEEEITWAARAADLTALALENAHLYAEVRAWADELEGRVEARTRELEHSQAQLRHAEKLAALGRLSASIAHEIGHPLSLIQGYIELLAEEQPDHPYLHPVRDSIGRLMRLLDQLRDFSRPATEERGPVAINEIADKVLTLAGQELRLNRVNVDQHLAADLPLIEADGRQLEQVFLNLLLNARDAMPQGGRLLVRTYQMADQVVIEFTDTGPGIPPEDMERIFEPYFTTKGDKGTGWGLAICQRIVEAHGGQIEVESEVGAGATFRVYLPSGLPGTV